MNSLVKLDSILTMSSVEIAELTSKEHKNVMVDIREMLKSLNKAVADFSATAFYEVNNAKREREIFNLPKRETLILVSGYSVTMRAKIIDRWQALEALQAPKFKVPATLSEALRLAANQAETIEKQTTQIEQQKPAVEFVDRFVNIKSSKSITEVAKILGVGQREFFDWLAEKKIIYKRSDNWLPASTYAKYFDVKIKQVSETKEVSQSRFVPAGIVWIATKWTKEKTQLRLGL
jgi:phage antirepressor YoqD-like protein